MYRIRFHGRGGQGTKTASRILGSAFFAEGFEAQDAPRYGAERRGAPIFATVRADHAPIRERGPILRPGLVVVADDTLVPIPTAGVLVGLDAHSVLMLRSALDADTWRERLRLAGPVFALPLQVDRPGALPLVGALCAGAAAGLVGVVSRHALDAALREELAGHGRPVVEENLAVALEAFDALAPHAGCVPEQRPLSTGEAPDWIELPLEVAGASAPDIHAAATSVQVRTGLWRTMRPEIDHDRCRRCHWVCSTLCPDGAILVADDGTPTIDYDHCKGCLVCVAVCPTHAIRAEPELRSGARP